MASVVKGCRHLRNQSAIKSRARLDITHLAKLVDEASAQTDVDEAARAQPGSLKDGSQRMSPRENSFTHKHDRELPWDGIRQEGWSR